MASETAELYLRRLISLHDDLSAKVQYKSVDLPVIDSINLSRGVCICRSIGMNAFPQPRVCS